MPVENFSNLPLRIENSFTFLISFASPDRPITQFDARVAIPRWDAPRGGNS